MVLRVGAFRLLQGAVAMVDLRKVALLQVGASGLLQGAAVTAGLRKVGLQAVTAGLLQGAAVTADRRRALADLQGIHPKGAGAASIRRCLS